MSHDPGPAFRALHRPGDPFVLANAWDIGSARLLAGLGARAIGTTSAGHAVTLGLPDGGRVGRDRALAHAEALVGATPLPVSADLEDGFGPAPEDVALSVRLAGGVGLAGCSIEDTILPAQGAHDRAHAIERVRAGVAAARSLGRDFVLVARADGVMTGAYDLEEALLRVRAFAEQGADCVYVPFPGDVAVLRRLVQAVDVPVNALAVGPLGRLTRDELAQMGVARISLGSALARMVHRTLHDAARAVLDEGRFDSHPMIGGSEIDRLMEAGAGGG